MGPTKKYPDNVVWSEEKGYYAHLLPYATNVGAPVIIPENVSIWKNEKILKTNHYFQKITGKFQFDSYIFTFISMVAMFN